jgi:toxin ParE1/3/4
MGYRLSRAADEDLVIILIDGEREFGLSRAERYVRGMRRCFELLGANPRLAQERPDIAPGLRVFPHRSHLVLYVSDDKGDVLVLRVRHQREDWTSAPL